MDQLLSHWLKIRPDERRRTALLFLFLFCATSFVIIGRTARDALLLARQSGVAQLPMLYVGIAIASSLMVVIYSRLMGRLNPYHLLQGTLTAVVSGLLILRLLIALEQPVAYPALYIFQEVAGSLIVLQFWTFANEAFTTREAKRLFSIIGSGGVMAGTVCGFGGAWLAPRLGTANLLVVCVLALVACLFLASAVWTLQRSILTPVEPRPAAAPAQSTPENDRYARSFAAMVLALVVSVSIIDYEFKVIAQQAFSPDRLASVFGVLYGTCGLLSFILHLLFTGRLLTRLGILPALLALPVALLAGAVGLILAPGIAVAMYAKAADATFRYSLNETCLQLLYLPLPVLRRRKLKASIEGGLKPLAIGATGVLMAVAGQRSDALRALAALLLAGLALWIALAIRLRGGYVSALLASLTRHVGLDEEIPVSLSDVASTQALVEALRSGDDRIVLGALELLPARRGVDWSGQVLPLLGARGRAVRLSAIDYCRREGIRVPQAVLESWLSEPDDEMRAAAVELLEGANEAVGFLKDPAPRVQAQAVVGLVRFSGEKGSRTALEVLEDMRTQLDEQARRWAAWVMGELGGPEEGLRRLINDSVRDVEREAIEAAGKAQLLGLAPQLVSRLRHPQLGDDAAAALGQYGEVVLSQLLSLLPLPAEDETFRMNVFTALRGIGTRRVAEELLRHLPSDRSLRHETLQVTFQLLRPRREGALRIDQIRAPLLVEMQDCYQWFAIAAALPPGEPWELLRGAVAEEGLSARERAFLILSHVYPVRPMQTLFQALQSQKAVQVANAVEVVDEIVDPDLRPMLLPLLEDLPASERVARGRQFFPLVMLNQVEWCRYFLRSGERWLQLSCLNTVRALGERTLVGELRSLLLSPDALIREGALLALSPLVQEAERAALWQAQLEDAAPSIRRLARAWQADREAVMISSVDKVLFLKRVDLFSELPGRELLNLASIAEQVTYSEKAVILEEGADGDSLYVILNGQVRVTRGGRPIALLGPRETFGEMALLDREPRSATVTAVDQVSALRIERDSFYDLLAQKREIALGIIRILVHRLRDANER